MRKALLAALVGLIPVQCVPTYAQTVGEMVEVRAICASREMVENHVTMSMVDRNYNRANDEFRKAAAEGLCYALPYPVQLPVQEVGRKSAPFTDNDGDRVRLTAIKIKGAWTMHLEILEAGKRS